MIALIDYDAGNTCSVINALRRAEADFILTDNPEIINKADKVIFPGVGHAKAAMESLIKKNLVDVIKNLDQPVLGICVGMQLMCDSSEEGDTECLGILPLRVQKFDDRKSLKVPHMGWNQIDYWASHPLFEGLTQRDYVYFVHSFYVPANDYSIADCHYGGSFSAAVQKDNFYGIQFHAEKSGTAGARLLSNFIKLKI